jgi:hypothetical protein
MSHEIASPSDLPLTEWMAPLKRLERAALLLAASGTAVVWVLPYLFFGTAVPEWILSRWYLMVCGPALLSGLVAFREYAGFAKAPVVIVCVALFSVGIAWTDPTELGRGALLAAGVLVPLPLAALIRRHDYLRPFLRAFSIATAGSLIFVVASTEGVQFGTLVDPTGTHTVNANSLGLQAALATLFLAMTFPRRKRLGAYIFVFLMAVLTFCCVTTASRTAFLALAGAFGVAMRFLGFRASLAVLAIAGAVVPCSLAINAVVDPAHPFYEGIVGRLIRDDDETRNTVGGRLQIWTFAVEEFAANDIWVYGTGTGGVDKALGRFYELQGRAKGRDGIWRLYAHNTLVWWALAFGIGGVGVYAWIGFSLARRAHQLDKKSDDWRRLTLVAFVALASVGGVITQEGYWCVLEAALLAMLSTDVYGSSCRSRLSLSTSNCRSPGTQLLARRPSAVALGGL